MISIIIPIYNAEKYLDRVLISICNQTYKNLEIILIDDGSTDNSYNICQRYASLDKRIKLIKQKNSGVSEARNKGLSLAKGDYIGFVDSDDVISLNMYEIMHNLIINSSSDIVGCQYKKFNKNINFVEDEKLNTYDKINSIKGLLNGNISNFLWDKLFKKELFKGLSFTKKIIYEDFDLMYKIFEKSNKFTFINSTLYGYFQRSDSYVHDNNEKKIMMYIDIYIKKYNYLLKNYKELTKQINESRVMDIFIVYRNVVLSGNKKLLKNEKILKEREKLKELRKNNINNISVFKKILINILCINEYVFYAMMRCLYRLKGDI